MIVYTNYIIYLLGAVIAIEEQSRPSNDMCIVLERDRRLRVGDDHIDIPLGVVGQCTLVAWRDTDLIVVQELAPNVRAALLARERGLDLGVALGGQGSRQLRERHHVQVIWARGDKVGRNRDNLLGVQRRAKGVWNAGLAPQLVQEG